MKPLSSNQGADICVETASKEPQKVVITLIHGTIFFSRWPWLVKMAGWKRWLCLCASRLCKKLFGGEGQGIANDLEWYKRDSTFAKLLTAAMKNQCEITSFSWNGFNTEWARLCAAGADADFRATKKALLGENTLRAQIAKNAADYPGCKQILVAHSHAGNLSFAALQDESTRKAVNALVCLSTPFINVRQRQDAATLIGYLSFAGCVTFLAAIFVSIHYSNRIPAPWNKVIWVGGFVLASAIWVVCNLFTEERRKILRQSAETPRKPFSTPPVSVLVADGDEALLALKSTEALSFPFRILWRLGTEIPLKVFAAQRRWGNKWWISGPVLIACVLVAFASYSSENPFGRSEWRLFGDAVVGVIGLLLLWCLLLALPGAIAVGTGYVGLSVLRWLGFGWTGYIDFEMSAETLPVGAAIAYRLEDLDGMRHCSYNHPEAPNHIARLIGEALGK